MMWWFVPVVMAAQNPFKPSTGLLDYTPTSFWKASSMGAVAFPPPGVGTRSRTMGLGVNAYNAGAGLLPLETRKALAPVYGRNVTFVAMVRRQMETGNCMTLVNGGLESGFRDAVLETLKSWDPSVKHVEGPGAYVLFDEEMRPIEPAVELVGDPDLVKLVTHSLDVRTETAIQQDGRKLLSHGWVKSTTFNDMQFRLLNFCCYNFWWIEVLPTRKPTARVHAFEHYNVSACHHGCDRSLRNMGILWSGKPRDRFELSYWLAKYPITLPGFPPEKDMINTFLPKLSSHAGNESNHALSNGLSGKRERSLHNGGGVPIDLDDWCPGVRLTLGHCHLDAFKRSFPARFGHTLWGNTYIQNFVLFNATPPFETLGVSRPFCFPSVAAGTVAPADSCDMIQFVAGFARLDDSLFEGGRDTVLITYGVNDCESAHLRIPIAHILDFIGPDVRDRYCNPH